MNFNRIFIFSFLFTLPIFLSGQFRDTTTSSHFGTNLDRTVYKKIAHNKSFPSSKYGLVKTLFKHNDNDLRYYFPDDFESGTDSVFVQSTEYGDTFFLNKILEFSDKRGTAKITDFYINGKTKSIQHYLAGELDTIIREMKSTSWGPEDYGTDSFYIDTSYLYTTIRHGTFTLYHDNGQLNYTTELNFDRHNGKVETFHANGKIASIEKFQDGYFIDTALYYFENGQLQNRVFYKNYLPHGVFKKWYSNGQINKEGILVYGKYDGEVKNYYENGLLKLHSRWKISEDSRSLEKIKEEEFKSNQEFIAEGGIVAGYDGTERDSAFITKRACQIKYTNYRQGKFEYWKEDGTKIKTELYLFGELALEDAHVSKNEIDDFFGNSKKDNCRKKVVLRLDDDEGMGNFKRKLCTKNIFGYQIDTFEVDYQKTLLDSIVQVMEVVEFEGPNGKCHYQRYYPNGKIKLEAFFEDSDFLVNMEEEDGGSGTVPCTGLWKYWYPNGNLKWEKKHDKVIGIEHISMEKTYYENGQIASEEYLGVDGHPGYYSHYTFKTYREWHKNGQLKEEIEYDPNGEKDGHFKNWDKNGILLKFEKYKEGELHGSQKYYDENGNLTKSEKYRKGKLIKSKK
ncbi:MAG: toxin-antitoxin system YwqK family antitoxin [Saprospiraceae bacterium]